jgi:fructuronate reductase
MNGDTGNMRNLTSLEHIAGGVRLPRYMPGDHGVGIVHLGIGAFHRAHQAVYTDDALAAEGGDWRIVGASLRSTDIVDILDRQNGFYTLLERGPQGTSARVVASIERAIAASRDPQALLTAMVDPAIRIVSMTVTEKAYGIDRANRAVDPAHPSIAPDLTSPRAPSGVIGLIVESLRQRRDAGIAPYTVLCCDNLPDNGGLIRAGALDLARRVDPDLAGWIEGEVAFPATMVDRITPASTDTTHADAARLTGCRDEAAVETEPFTQWVIEDEFSSGRPAWEAGGAIFTSDVAPYEHMKLRMLNGSHSLMAYAGFLAGLKYVRDAIAWPPLAALVRRHLTVAASTLRPLEGVDFADYAAALVERFANPAIAHETYQIAMDGTEKLPQRLLQPAVDLLERGGDIRPFAFAVAAWMRYALGRTDAGQTYALRDPREKAIAAALDGTSGDPAVIAASLHALPGGFPERLRESPAWTDAVTAILADMLALGVDGAVASEAARGR